MKLKQLNRKILALALPFLAANISIPMLGLVDTAVLGHLESEVYLGAIALGGMIFNFLFWGFGFLKMGTTGFTSQAKGKGNSDDISLIFQRGVIIALLLGGLILLLRMPIWHFTSMFLDGSADVLQHTKEYYSIRAYSAPAVFILYVLLGWFLGMQNALYVLYVTIVENVSNIAFNLIFVYVFHMRADGVALGTVCAQYLALGFGLILLFHRYPNELKKHSFAILMKSKEILHLLKVNADIMIRTISLMFVFAYFTVKSSSMNDTVLASNMILMQFLTVFSYVTDGFAHAGESLAGFYFGARKRMVLLILIRRLFIWSSIVAVCFSLIYGLFFYEILHLLTGQEAVIETASRYKIWIIILPIVSFSAYVWDGIFIGLTAVKQLRNAMLASVLLGFLPWAIFLSDLLENHALWLALALFLSARGFILWLMFQKLRKSSILSGM